MLNIEIDKSQAQKQVDELGASILDLAAKAEQASKGVGKNIDFSTVAKREMSQLKTQFKEMNELMKSMNKQFRDTADAIKQQANAGMSNRGIMSQMTKAVNDQTQALNNQVKAINSGISATQKMGVQQGQAAAAARQMTTAMNQHAASSRQAVGGFNALSQATAAFRATLQGAGQGFGIFTGQTIAIATAAYATTKALKASLTVGAEFADEFTKAAVAANGFDEKTGKMTSGSKALRLEVLALGAASRQSSTEIAGAAKALAQAGKATDEIAKMLPSVMNMATLEGVDPADAAKKLVNTMTVFKIGAEGASTVADKLTKASQMSTTTIDELGTALGQAGSVAAEAGVSLNSTLAALSLMRQVGISASKSGTDLRNIILSLAKPSKNAAAELKQLGLSANDFWSNDGFQLEVTLKKLAKAFQGMSEKSKEAAVNTLFDRRTAGAVLSMTNQIELLDEYNKGVEKSIGLSQRMADIVNNNATGQFKQLKNTVENILIGAFDQYSGGLVKSLSDLTKYLQTHSAEISKVIADIAKKIVDVAALIIRNFKLIATVVQAVVAWKVFGAAVRMATGTLELFAKASKAASAASAAGSTGGIAARLGGMATSASAASRAFSALRGVAGALFTALGGWAAVATAGVLALAYGIYKIYEASQDTRPDLVELTGTVQDFSDIAKEAGNMSAGALDQALRQLMPTYEALNEYISKTNDLMMGRGMAGYFNDMKEEWQNLKNIVANPMGAAFAGVGQSDLDKNLRMQNDTALKAHALFLDAAAKMTAERLGKTDFLAPYQEAIIATGGNIEQLQGLLKDGVFGFLPEGMTKDQTFLSHLYSAVQGVAQAKKDAAELANAVAMGPPSNLAPKSDSPGVNAEAISEAKARASELASELKKIVTEYEKQTGSTMELHRNLEQINAIQGELTNKTSAASVEMRKLGLDSKEVQAALEHAKGQTVLDYLSAKLGEIDPRFKSLKLATSDVAQQTLDATAVMNMMNAELAKNPEMAAAAAGSMGLLKQTLTDTATGSTAAKAEFAKLNEELVKLKAESGMPKTSEGLIEYFTSLGKVTREAAEETVYGIRYYKTFGSILEKTQTETQKMEEATKLLDFAQKKLNLSDAERNRLAKEYLKTTPTGKLKEENAILQQRIGLMGKSAQEQYVMSKAYEQFGSDLDGVTEGFLAAAAANYQLNEQMKQIEEVQGAFHDFADGLAKTFAGLFDGTTKGFKDMGHKIRDLFKTLLHDLIYMAIRNQIVLYMTGQGSGTSAGGFGAAVMNGFGAMFGQGGGSANSGGMFTGMMSSFFGGGGGGMNMSNGSVAGSLLNAYAGGGGGGGTAAGNYGSSLLSMMFSKGGGAGGSGFQLFSPSTWMNAGKSMYNGFMYGNNTGYGGNFMGSFENMGGNNVWTPSTMGTALSVAGGAYAGYNRYQNSNGGAAGVAGGLAYGIGTVGLAGGMASLMAGGGFAAGMGGALGAGAAAGAGSMGLAAAIPVIGWIALAAMLIDMISGGKLFGTKFQTKGSTVGLNLGAEGGSASLTLQQERQGALFSGKKKRDKNATATADMQKAADDLFNAIHKIMVDGAAQLAIDTPPMINASLRTVYEYDKKGKVKSTKYFVDVLGKHYEEQSAELAQTRLAAEAMIATVASSNVGKMASTIAEQWRGSAEALMDGAQFLLKATTDIQRNSGLLGQGATLEKTAEVVTSFQKAGEKLTETYARLLESVNLTDQTLAQFGASLGKNREEYVGFSANLVESLGGLSEAGTKLQNFAKAFGTFGAYSDVAAQTARASRAGSLSALGIDPNATAEEFINAFSTALQDGMSGQEAAQWVEAGNKIGAITLALKDMQNQLDGTGTTLVDQVNEQIKQIQMLGANETELAKARELGNQIIQKALGDFMFGIEGQLADFEGRTHVHKLNEIKRAMEDAIRQAVALGASEKQLARIRQLAAYQAAQVLNDLRQSLASSIHDYYNMGTDSASTMQSQYEAQQQASHDLYESEMQRYQDAQAAIKQIDEFLKKLTVSELNPQGWTSRMTGAKNNFMELLLKAKAGDKDALAQITSSAQDYLDLARQYYGSTEDYGNIYDFVVGALRDLQIDLGHVQPPGPEPTTGGSASGSSSLDQANAAQDRYKLALQIAQQLGELHLATGADVFKLMKDNGVKLADLARDLGIDLMHIDDTTGGKLQLLSGALGISLSELTKEMGISAEQLQKAFNISIAGLVAGNGDSLASLADSLGGSVFDALDYLGIKLSDLAVAAGIDVNNLTASTAASIATLSGTLGVLPSTLASQLGIQISALATAFGVQMGVSSDANFSSLVEFSKLMKISLEQVAAATNQNGGWLWTKIGEEVNRQLVTNNSLPEAIKDKLSSLLSNIAQSTDLTGQQSALVQMKDYIATLTGPEQTTIKKMFSDLGIDITGGTGKSLGTLDTASAAIKEGLMVNGQTQSGVDLIYHTLLGTYGAMFGGEYGVAQLPISANISNWPTQFSSSAASTFGEIASTSQIISELLGSMLAPTDSNTTTTMDDEQASYADSQLASQQEIVEQLQRLEETVETLTNIVDQRLAVTNDANTKSEEHLEKLSRRAKMDEQPQTRSKAK